MGLGDFVSGIGEGVSEIASSAGGAIKNTVKAAGVAAKGVEWAANPHHWDDIGRGAVKGAEFVGQHIEDTAKGVGFLATHPQYWDDAAKKMIVDQFTNPVNIVSNVAMLGLTVATGGLGGAGLLAKAGEVAEGVAGATKVAEAVDATATAAKVGESASTAAKVADASEGIGEAAVTTSRGSRFQQGAQAFQSKLDAASQLPTKIHQSIRESLGLNPLTTTQRARQGLAEGFLERTGGIESQGSGVLEHARQFVGQRIANAPGAPSLVGGGDAGKFASVNYRANKLSSQVSAVKDFRSNLQNKALMVEAVADPEKAALGLAKAHEGDILKFGARHAGDAAVSSIKNSLFGNKKSPSTTTPQFDAPAAPATTNWERSDTGMVASQPRRSSSFGSGAVTTTSATSADAVGPSKWYGQTGYSTGRGFQSPSSQQQWGTTPWTQDPAYS